MPKTTNSRHADSGLNSPLSALAPLVASNDTAGPSSTPGVSFARTSAPPGPAGTVFIQANERQMVGALVAAHALRATSAHPESFDVRIIKQEDFDFFRQHEGMPYLKHGKTRVWRNDDLQSFTPTRFMAPELLGYQGRAVVSDPDIFALADIHELLTCDMQGAAIMCRRKPRRPGWNSSVMLLDCPQLTHWKCRANFEEMFTHERDYSDWNSLLLEPEGSIALLDDAWNSFDELNEHTKLLHNTNRRTQPWKTGLPIEFTPGEKFPAALAPIVHSVRHHLASLSVIGEYRRHPDHKQEQLFFRLLRDSLDAGVVTREFLADEMAALHLRADALTMVDRLETRPIEPATHHPRTKKWNKHAAPARKPRRGAVRPITSPNRTQNLSR